jgi:phage host-nuclease inhibitor protein Gam
MQAILCQAASNFQEIGHLQTQVTKSETAVDQLMAMDSKLAETKAALKKDIAGKTPFFYIQLVYV